MSLAVVTILGLLAVVVLAVLYLKFRSNDVLQEILKKRAGAKVSAVGSFVEGAGQVPVAVSLTDSSFFYENGDMEARLDLERVDEVEYDDELSTAREVKEGRVMRLRSHGQTFEFIFDEKTAERFSSFLPPHKMGEAGSVRAV